VLTSSTGTVIWNWPIKGNPFGDKQPAALSGYAYNLRFAGQYYDAEAGLYYNVHRYYAPGSGRYTQSDPLGLLAGMSTYLYVGGSPLDYLDSFGLNGQAANAWALQHVGQGGYGYFDSNSEARGWLRGKTNGIPSEKCNKFVWDALSAGGDSAGRMPDGRIPSAAEWGDPNADISGYYVLPSDAQLEPGDVVSSGTHVGLYSPLSDGAPGTVSAAFPMSSWAAGPGGNVVHNDWGFRPGQHVTVRRSLSDQLP
jgi:RHS repeat-associated protein